jgi:YfiH family protein
MLVLRAKNLSALPGIAHGFFGRTGGVSSGVFATLNCGPGSGDDRAAVRENRRRAAEALAPGATLVNVHQIHSATAVAVTEPWALGNGPKADAMATTVPGIALGILTADCAPVLFADSRAGVIGAAHAGWKGALGGVLEAAIDAMERLGAERARIAAAIGPCISQANYEVGPEFRTRFLDPDPANSRFFVGSDRAGHFRFDLEAYAAARLGAAGLADIGRLSACTYGRETDFFSYRRTTHRRETDYGRQVSAIFLTGAAAN